MNHFNPRHGGTVYFAGTFNAHASCLAAALATIEILESGKVHDHIFRLGDRMRAGLREIVARVGVPGVVTGFGSVYVLYFMSDELIVSYYDLLENDASRLVRYRQGPMKRGALEMALNLKRQPLSYS